MRRATLPPGLGHAFTVSAGLRAGASRSRLSAADLAAPFHGVRSSVREVESDAAEEARRRALEYAPRLSAGAFFVGPTAAALWEAEVPGSIHVGGLTHVATARPGRAPRGRGVHGRSLDPALARSVLHPRWRVPVATPATTWALLGTVLHDRRDLVAAGDFFVRDLRWRNRRPPLATIDQLAAATAAGPRAGVAALRRALPAVRTRSASRPETWTRMILVDAGLSEPELNIRVHDDDGAFLGCPDLAYPTLKIGLEYEGERHLGPQQWARDIARYERFAAAGWTVIRVTKADVFRLETQLVTRVRRALHTRGL